MMKQRLEKLIPPGFSLKTELTVYIVGIIAAFLYSGFVFGTQFENYFCALYDYNFRGKTLIEGAVMKNFYWVCKDSFAVFALMLLVSALMIALHYAYHFQQSKSIYLMRRLPNRALLHKRCFALPLIAAVLSVAAAVLTLAIYYQIYIHFTPKQCLLPGQIEKLLNNWRVLL